MAAAAAATTSAVATIATRFITHPPPGYERCMVSALRSIIALLANAKRAGWKCCAARSVERHRFLECFPVCLFHDGNGRVRDTPSLYYLRTRQSNGWQLRLANKCRYMATATRRAEAHRIHRKRSRGEPSFVRDWRDRSGSN